MSSRYDSVIESGGSKCVVCWPESSPAGKKVFTATKCCFSQNSLMSFLFCFLTLCGSLLLLCCVLASTVLAWSRPSSFQPCPLASSRTLGVQRCEVLLIASSKPVVNLPCSPFRPSLSSSVCWYPTRKQMSRVLVMIRTAPAPSSAVFNGAVHILRLAFRAQYLQASRIAHPVTRSPLCHCIR